LAQQGEVTVDGMSAFARWSAGDHAMEALVRAREHDADKVRRQLLGEVRHAFVTPISPEDIFELSERLDAIMNSAKDIVREADLLGMAPDRFMAEMSAPLLEGTSCLVEAMSLVHHDADRATGAADAAVHQQRQLERVYRRAMSALLEVGEIREVTGRRELYRRYARTGDVIESVADRVWYAVVKQG
jgi:uncharacterized protein Yka (UPF0111/DUF47 family)